MINLKFKIISCYYDSKTLEQKYVIIKLSNDYNNKEKLENILKELYTTYGINS